MMVYFAVGGSGIAVASPVNVPVFASKESPSGSLEGMILKLVACPPWTTGERCCGRAPFKGNHMLSRSYVTDAGGDKAVVPSQSADPSELGGVPESSIKGALASSSFCSARCVLTPATATLALCDFP